MKKKNLLIFGNYGGQNWGDEAILSGILSVLPRDAFDITIVSSNPEKTQKYFGVNAVFPPPAGVRSFFREILLSKTSKDSGQAGMTNVKNAIKKADMVIFGGGGLLQNREKKAIFLWKRYASLCRKKRVIFVANSVGPLTGFCARRMAKKAIKNAKFFSVRDIASAELLQELDFPKKNIVLASDAVFLTRKKTAPKTKKGTLIALRGDGKYSEEKVKNLFSSLPKPITAIAMDSVDADFAKKLGVPVKNPKNIDDLNTLFASAAFVLSSRLHGALLSLHNETPFLALSAAPKVQNFLEERGLMSLVFPEKISSLELSKKIKEITTKKTEWKKIISAVRKKEVAKAKNIFPAFLR